MRSPALHGIALGLALGALLVARAADGRADAFGSLGGPRGALVQLPGRAGCLVPPQSALGRRRVCAPVRGLALGTRVLAASQDGRHVYVAGGVTWSDSAVAVLRRDSRTGAIVQPRGRAGCVGAFDCAPGIGVNGPSALAISPGGRHVLVANPPGVRKLGIYARAARTGTLRPVGCVGGFVHSPCPEARVTTRPSAIAVSPDGKNVYVASPDAIAYRGLAIFSRNPEGGRLSQLEGKAGCIQRLGTGGFGDPCAKPVIDAFSPVDVAITPDGRHVYVSSLASGGTAVFAFNRDSRTGALAPLPGTAACLSEGRADHVCAEAHSLGGSLALSPDGRNLYVGGDGLAVFRRDLDTGELMQLPRGEACVTSRREARCPGGVLALSPDGGNVYVASREDGVIAFARSGRRGGLVQLPGRAGCYSERGNRCTRVRGLGSAGDVTVSPDGRNVYVTEAWWPRAGAVVAFRRVTAAAR